MMKSSEMSNRSGKNMRNTVSVVLGFLAFATAVSGAVWIMNMPLGKLAAAGVRALLFYTVLSNLLFGGVMLVLSLYRVFRKKKEAPLPGVLRKFHFLSLVGVFITFLTVLLYLAPIEALYGNGFLSLYEGGNFLLHLVVPLIGIIDYLFFVPEGISFRETFLGLVTPALYGVFYLVNVLFHLVSVNGEENGYDWYGFYGDGSPLRVVLFLLVFFLLAYLFSFLLFLLRKKIQKE